MVLVSTQLQGARKADMDGHATEDARVAVCDSRLRHAYRYVWRFLKRPSPNNHVGRSSRGGYTAQMDAGYRRLPRCPDVQAFMASRLPDASARLSSSK